MPRSNPDRDDSRGNAAGEGGAQDAGIGRGEAPARATPAAWAASATTAAAAAVRSGSARRADVDEREERPPAGGGGTGQGTASLGGDGRAEPQRQSAAIASAKPCQAALPITGNITIWLASIARPPQIQTL